MFFFGIRKVAAALQDEITLLLTGGADAESIFNLWLRHNKCSALVRQEELNITCHWKTKTKKKEREKRRRNEKESRKKTENKVKVMILPSVSKMTR